MLEEVRRVIRSGGSFAFESTLSGKSYLRLITQARVAGYAIRLFYLWILDPALAVARIRDRVDGGGHDVPEPDVRRRYGRTLRNFFTLYRTSADSVYFFNNTGNEPELVFKDEERNTTVYNLVLYQTLQTKWSQS